MKNVEVIEEALAWVNEVRRARGLQLLEAFPPGVPCDPCACTVSLALDAAITFDGLVVPRDGLGTVTRLPDVVLRFANAFDLGAYPALEQGTPVPAMA